MCLGKGGGDGGRDGGLETDRIYSQNYQEACGSHPLRLLTLSRTGEATAEVEVQPLHAFGEDECTNITGEARAAVEVQVLHAFGEDECTDITCKGRKKREIREDGRRESAAAHG